MILDKLLIPFVSQTDAHGSEAAHSVADTLADTLSHVGHVAGQAAGHVAEHAAEHGGEHGGSHELPNIITVLYKAFGETFSSLHHWENIIFAFIALIFLCVVAMVVYRKREMIPGPLQNFVELIVEGLYNFFHSMLGDHAKKYTPFLGTLFLYILVMNWMGIIPFLKAPTSAAVIPFSLAIVVFIYSQSVGFKHLGVIGWLNHLAGEPKGVIGWALVPLMIPIHLIGEIAKPVSLAFRLFGNITGEDILVAAFAMLGILALSFAGPSPVGLPLQLPFYFLGLLMSTIQALVFASLAAIYIALMLPHEHEGEGH